MQQIRTDGDRQEGSGESETPVKSVSPIHFLPFTTFFYSSP